MKEFTYTITDPVGIHARPAGLLVKAVKALDSTVTITNTASLWPSSSPTICKLRSKGRLPGGGRPKS